jgi:hypothetical protein
MTNRKLVARSEFIAVAVLAMWFGVFWNWFVRGVWKNLEKQARESPEFCKQSRQFVVGAQKTSMLVGV